jgi:hypothetical protein
MSEKYSGDQEKKKTNWKKCALIGACALLGAEVLL